MNPSRLFVSAFALCLTIAPVLAKSLAGTDLTLSGQMAWT